MTQKQCHLTENSVYKANRKFTPKGVMLHSTATPGVMAEDWPERWNKSSVDKCVHGFVDDKGVVWTLPLEMRSVHCGFAYEGGPSANSTHFSLEICEPRDMTFHYRHPQSRDNKAKSNVAHAIKGIQRQLTARGLYTGSIDGSFGPGTESAVKEYQASKKLTVDGLVGANTWKALAAEPEKHCVYNPDSAENKAYFDAAYANAAEVTAQLCKQYGFDPLADGIAICHSEGNARKIASNHSDVMHWFPLHGQNMDMFRYAVKSKMGGVSAPSSAPASIPAQKRPVLKKGAYGHEVKEMQELLIKAGIKMISLSPCGADGSFGPSTDAAVRTFQKMRGLVVDGSCGPLTWAALLA